MQVNYNNNTYKSLTEMAKKSPQDRKFMESFREKSIGILDNAVDVFFKSDREESEGRVAINDLMDLESAMRACAEWARKKTAENKGIIEKKAEDNNYQLEKGKTEIVENQEIKGHYGNVKLERGKIVTGDEKVMYSLPYQSDLDKMEGIEKFINDLHQVLPLYTCVAMVPGPISVTVKNMAQETLKSSEASSSYSYEESQTLFSSSASRSISSSSSETTGEKKSADERVIPGLMDLKARLEEMEVVKGKEGNLFARSDVENFQTIERRTFPVFGKKVDVDISVYKGQQDRPLEKAEYEPAHVWLPGDGTGTLRGERNGITGKPLTELAHKVPSDKDALEEFKEKSKEVIDRAVDTFFKSDREFEEGKKAVENLSDLQTALKTFIKEGTDNSYDMSKIIDNFHDALGLYTCVALAPGPMSATVKSMPKISINSHSSGGSHSVSKSKGLFSTKESTSFSHSESRFDYNITTTDERVIPVLMDVRTKIDTMEIKEEKDGKNKVDFPRKNNW